MSGSERAAAVRLRQAVFAAAELEPVATELRSALGLEEPFRDPGVAMFGLQNVVFALGDCFLEVVSPTAPGTAAGRYLERHGRDAGYMVMFDVRELPGARSRAHELGVRAVWEIDLPDISGTHLHPVDMGGAIVSIDSSNPYGSWRWGGPLWTGRAGSGAPGRLAGVTLAVADPQAAAARWGAVLGVPVSSEGPRPRLALDGAGVEFERVQAGRPESLVEIALALPHALPGARECVEIAGVRVRRVGP